MERKKEDPFWEIEQENEIKGLASQEIREKKEKRRSWNGKKTQSESYIYV